MRLAFVRVFNSGNRNKDIRQECGSAQHGTIYRYHTDNTTKVKYNKSIILKGKIIWRK